MTHANVILQKQANSGDYVSDSIRLKSEFGGHAWHTIGDKNSLIYGAVTSLDYPDDLISLFLRQLASNLYDECS